MSDTIKTPMYSLVIAWVLLFPLLFFVARGTISFDRTSTLGAAEGDAITDSRPDSTYYRAEQILVYAVVAALIVPSIPGLTSVISENLLILSLPCLALLSAFWTQSPQKTIPFGVFAIALTVFGIYLSMRFSPERQIDLFLFVGWAAIILSFLAVLFFPNAGIQPNDSHGAWRGMFILKNHMGEVMTLLIYAAFCVKPKNSLQRVALGLYILLASVLVIMSQSRTCWILLALSLCFAAYLKILSKIRGQERLLLTGALAVILLIVAGVSVAYASEIAVFLGKDPTLTGRTKIWGAVATVLWKRPLLGFGYRAFWLGLKGESLNLALAVGSTSLVNSENAIFEIWLELGVVGVILMLLPLFQACRNAITCLRHDSPAYVHWFILIVFFNVVALIDGGKIMFPHTIEWLLFVMAYVGLSAEARRVRSRQTA